MRRILLANPFGIGDALFTLSLAESIRQAQSDAFIGFLCNERTVDVVRSCRAVDMTIVFNRDRLRKLRVKSLLLSFKKIGALKALIREQRFDTLLDLSLGREYAFLAMRAGIRHRVGLDYRGRGLFLTKKIKVKGYSDESVADTQRRLLPLAGIPAGAARAVSSLSVDPPFSKLPKGRFIAVAPGGGKSWGPNAPYKQWAPERFADAASRFCRERGWGAVVLADRSERDLAERVSASLGVEHTLQVGQPLPEAAAILKKSELLLCNDGGLMHLAHALGTKVVALFGPVDEKVYGPYGEGAPARLLTAAVPCRPCYADFKFPPCRFDKQCLTGIPAERAVTAMKELCA